MNKESALQEVRTIEARLAELRKIIEQPEEVGLWEPGISSECFYMNSCGDVSRDVNHGMGLVEKKTAHGNCFQTEAIALKASQLQRVHNHVMRACFQADPDAGEWTESCSIGVYKSGNWISSKFHRATELPCVHTESQAIEACRLLNAWQAKEGAK